MAHSEDLEQFYRDYHSLVFAIAYRMLGSASDAEDIAQETFLRYTQAPADEIRSPKSYLTTVTTRLCLDHLKSARVQREQYSGVWLPEPILTTETDDPAADALERRESLSMAFLLLLERLTPYERAVFLLREVFDYGYDEIAEIVGKSATYCRQIFHQAKKHVQEQRPRYLSTPEVQQRLVREFVTAIEQGEVESLVRVLAEDVTWWGDGGGKVYASPHPQVGRERSLRLLRGIVRLAPSQYPDLRVAVAEVNGGASILAWSHETLVAVFAFEVAGDRITAVYGVLAPDKLLYAQRQAQR
jgi:RNA polymerase sigma-70 factor, ECF subfamily